MQTAEHFDADAALGVLKSHLAICQDLLAQAENDQAAREEQAGPRGSDESRRNSLSQLVESLSRLRAVRMQWQRLSLSERERYPEVPALLRRNQDLILKIVLLQNQNEQALLREGMVPARHLPSVNRQRPHFVAELYRRQGGV